VCPCARHVRQASLTIVMTVCPPKKQKKASTSMPIHLSLVVRSHFVLSLLRPNVQDLQTVRLRRVVGLEDIV
jgi:hypothetical protein